MADDRAWLVIWKDISRETAYTVYLNEKSAEAAVGEAIGGLAKQEVESIDFDKEDADRLHAIVKAAGKGNWKEVINDWDEWRSDKGPLDDDVEIMEIFLFT